MRAPTTTELTELTHTLARRVGRFLQRQGLLACAGEQRFLAEEGEEKTAAQRRVAMTWAQRLKRVFGIDIATCSARGVALRLIACIEDPAVIKKILANIDTKEGSAEPAQLPPCRVPPPAGLF